MVFVVARPFIFNNCASHSDAAAEQRDPDNFDPTKDIRGTYGLLRFYQP